MRARPRRLELTLITRSPSEVQSVSVCGDEDEAVAFDSSELDSVVRGGGLDAQVKTLKFNYKCACFNTLSQFHSI